MGKLYSLPAKLNYFGYLNQCSLNLEIKPFCKSRDKLSEIWNLLGGVWNQVRGDTGWTEAESGICRRKYVESTNGKLESQLGEIQNIPTGESEILDLPE